MVYTVIDHVNQQTKYMADTQRRNLTLAEFIEQYHFTSTGNYQSIVNAGLKQRFTQYFGK